MVAGWRGRLHPREVILTEGSPGLVPGVCVCEEGGRGGLSGGPRIDPSRKMRSGKLEQVRSFSQVCPCLSVQLTRAHSSLKQGPDLLRNWNQSCRADRCPASLGLYASSDRALTTPCCGKASLC